MSAYDIYFDGSVIELPSRRLVCHPILLRDAEKIVAALNHAEADRAAEMREALEKARGLLTSDRFGKSWYMDGSDFYRDARLVVEKIDSALRLPVEAQEGERKS